MPTETPAPRDKERNTNPHNGAHGPADPQRRVLLAIQDADTARVLSSAFAFHGLASVHMPSGHDALAEAQRQAPELIVLDLEQPDMDGLVLLSDLRERSAAPIIVCGPPDQRREALLAFRLGADDFVAKPFDVDDVVARGEVALRRRGTVAAADSATQPAAHAEGRVPAEAVSPRARAGDAPQVMSIHASEVPVSTSDAFGDHAGMTALRDSASQVSRDTARRTAGTRVASSPAHDGVVPVRLGAAPRAVQRPDRSAEHVDRAGALWLDHTHHRVGVADREVKLSRSEYLLLGALVSRPDELLSRLDLARAVWGEQLASVGRPIDQHMYRLRAKLQQAATETGSTLPPIVSVPGFGYRLVADGAVRAAG